MVYIIHCIISGIYCGYVCVYMGLFIYLCVYVCVCMYVCVCVCVCVYVCVCVCVYLYATIYNYILLIFIKKYFHIINDKYNESSIE